MCECSLNTLITTEHYAYMEIMYMSNFLGNKEAFERKMLAKIQGRLVCKLLSSIDNMDGQLLFMLAGRWR